MPKRLHDKLVREARAKGYKPGTPEFDRYVYGTLNRIERKKGRSHPTKRSHGKKKR